MVRVLGTRSRYAFSVRLSSTQQSVETLPSSVSSVLELRLRGLLHALHCTPLAFDGLLVTTMDGSHLNRDRPDSVLLAYTTRVEAGKTVNKLYIKYILRKAYALEVCTSMNNPERDVCDGWVYPKGIG